MDLCFLCWDLRSGLVFFTLDSFPSSSSFYSESWTTTVFKVESSSDRTKSEVLKIFGRDLQWQRSWVAELREEHKPWQPVKNNLWRWWHCEFIFQELPGWFRWPRWLLCGTCQRCHRLENPHLHFQVHSSPNAKALGLFLQTWCGRCRMTWLRCFLV